jgi:tetratricopeptide (TPR) repeat protein
MSRLRPASARQGRLRAGGASSSQAAIGLLAVVALVAAGACTPKTLPPANVAPKYPAFPTPDVPAALKVTAEVRDSHALAWRRLQAGDLRGAQRDFAALVKQQPTFYPAETGLGYVALADGQYKTAVTRFTAATARNDRYLPAWLGLSEAEIGLNDDAGAIAALERVVTIDPKRESARTRLELLRFRQLQTLLESARRARQAGRLPEAESTLEKALSMSPSSNLVLRELAGVETARGALDAAEGHARKAIQVDPSDAESHAALGGVLKARDRYLDAAAAYAKAASLDPRAEWTDEAEALREKAITASIPAEFRDLPNAATVTRGQLAAFISVRLAEIITAAPKRPVTVATDIRNHWAAPSIVAVTQAGIMDVFANHTFQPGATVSRGDLAQAVSQLLRVAGSARPAELAKWRAARPKFADLPGTHLSYSAAALAVSAGAMTVQAGDRFVAARAATGREVAAAVTRIEQIAGR